MTVPILDAKTTSGFGTSPQIQRVEPRLAIVTIVGFWVLYFVINTLKAAMFDHDDQWDMVKRRSAVVIAGMIIVGLVCLLLRRVEGKSLGVMLTTGVLAALPASVGYASFNYTMFYLVNPSDALLREMAAEPESYHRATAIIADFTVNWFFFFVAWSGLYVALSYATKIRQIERTAALYRAAAQSAQLRALRYQINPHFLFNTLNSLSTLVLRQRNVEAEKMIMNLASFFRTSLTGDPTEDVTLAEEIRTQRLYLEIEQNRFPERLLVTIDVPPELEQALVPGFILQPLVENAIKYGVSRSVDPVTVAIQARAEGGDLMISVVDDGCPSFEAPAGTGVGLKNVTDRLATHFDGAASMRFGPRAEGGFRVDLKLPLRPELLGSQ
jgi:two-component sensor histidine kinase